MSTGRGRDWLVRAAVLGVVAGFLGGLFGVGGGILIVPALVLFMHMDQRLAHGTSLAAVLPIAVASLIGYTLEDKVDWPVGVLLAIGAVGGAVIGTHILHVLPQRGPSATCSRGSCCSPPRACSPITRALSAART